MKAVVQSLDIPQSKRLICVSDIHGSLGLFKRLLEKVGFSTDDELFLLGDLYTKGRDCHETLRYIIKLSERENVHPLRGNCDWYADYLEENERKWLENLPHIIKTDKYIFVHGGLKSEKLDELEAESCMKNDNFMEQGLKFNRYVLTGHWPTVNYQHKIPSHNPIVDEKSHIIAIDGGNVLNSDGQLNAFFIHNGGFSYDFVDALPRIKAPASQEESGGTLNITWLDHFVELIEHGEYLSLCRHLKTGRTLYVANDRLWTDEEGRLCARDTDYFPKIEKGEEVSLCGNYGDRIYIKRNGTTGWLRI